MNEVNPYICTYNEETNILLCLESIYNAGLMNPTVVDGGSTDKTVILAHQAGAHVLFSHKGLSSQREVAIKNCKKPFLFFVDADDRLDSYCPADLYEQMKDEGYDALQAQLRVLDPLTYWQRGMDALLRYCICLPGETRMVGRPALYRTGALKTVGMDTRFDGVGNEDAALSIRMEKSGFKQGIGLGICYRKHPATFRENFAAWRKYGAGDARLIRLYPRKFLAIINHLLINYPIKRSLTLIRNGSFREAGYPVFVGLARFLFMCSNFIYSKK